MLDATKDGYIGEDDFRSMESFNGHRSPKKLTIPMKKIGNTTNVTPG
jgi:hypothetical protein